VTTAPSPQPLPTVADLARALGVHVATVYRACNSGEIAAVKIRGTVRIPWREYRRLTGDDTGAVA
jgi:excisionase family DNA binding protein